MLKADIKFAQPNLLPADDDHVGWNMATKKTFRVYTFKKSLKNVAHKTVEVRVINTIWQVQLDATIQVVKRKSYTTSYTVRGNSCTSAINKL